MKKLKFLVALFTLLLLQSNLQAGSQLTGETKFKDKKINNSSTIVFEFGSDSLDSEEVIRSQVTAEDVKPPMLVENRLMDFSAVQVYGTAAPGSGVIIAKKNNYYYVLTAKHVIGKILKGDEIEIMTIDGIYHLADLIKVDEKIDAALIKFKSKNKYYPAFFDPKTRAISGQKSVVIGYALASKETKVGSLRKSKGSILTVIKDNIDGYDILYNNATNVGMSGGPLYANMPKDFLNRNGGNGGSCGWLIIPPLIGLHGRAESYVSGGKSGANMGLSIHTVLNSFKNEFINEGVKKLPMEEETLLFKDGCPLFPR